MGRYRRPVTTCRRTRPARPLLAGSERSRSVTRSIPCRRLTDTAARRRPPRPRVGGRAAGDAGYDGSARHPTSSHGPNLPIGMAALEGQVGGHCQPEQISERRSRMAGRNRRQRLVRRPTGRTKDRRSPRPEVAGPLRARILCGRWPERWDGLFAVLAGTREPGDPRHCADRVLVRTIRCLHRARRVMI